MTDHDYRVCSVLAAVLALVLLGAAIWGIVA